MHASSKTLDQALNLLGFSLIAFRARTGISVKRLRSIFKDHDPTPEEFRSLINAIGPAFTALIAGIQAGGINQSGTLNRQRNIIHNFNVQINVHSVPQPRTKSHKPKALSEPLTQWRTYQSLPSGQHNHFGQRTLTNERDF